VAPARYALTALHRRDPASGPGQDGAGEPTVGQTLCGLLMGADELWVPAEARDGDPLCRQCTLASVTGTVAGVLPGEAGCG